MQTERHSHVLSKVRSYISTSLIPVELFGKMLLSLIPCIWFIVLRSGKYSVFAVLNTCVLVCSGIGVIFLKFNLGPNKKPQTSKHVAAFVNVSDSCKTIRICDNFQVFLKTNLAFANVVEISGCHLPFIVTISLLYKNDNKYLALSQPTKEWILVCSCL